MSASESAGYASYDWAAPGSQLNWNSTKIINDIKDYLLSVRGFWSSLPGAVCNMSLAAMSGGARRASTRPDEAPRSKTASTTRSRSMTETQTSGI